MRPRGRPSLRAALLHQKACGGRATCLFMMVAVLLGRPVCRRSPREYDCRGALPGGLPVGNSAAQGPFGRYRRGRSSGQGDQQRQVTVMRDSRGVTYLFVMLAVVLMGISATVVAKQWKTVVQREREAELLTRGIEIQNALAVYSAQQKKGRVVPGEIYPLTLEELTKQPRP